LTEGLIFHILRPTQPKMKTSTRTCPSGSKTMLKSMTHLAHCIQTTRIILGGNTATHRCPQIFHRIRRNLLYAEKHRQWNGMNVIPGSGQNIVSFSNIPHN